MRKALVLAVLAILCLVCAAPVLAQTVEITRWDLRFFMPGVDPATGDPYQVQPIPFASATCTAGSTTPSTDMVVNPRYVEWAQGDQRCVVDLQAIFMALPVGTGWRASLVAINEAGSSAQAVATNPFKRLDPPPIPVNVWFRR